MKHTRWILLAGVLAISGLIGYWFTNHFESYEREHKVGQQAAARANPLLAAERFLHRIGLRTEVAPDLLAHDSRPPPRALLIIDAPRAPLGERGQQRLLDWVRAGGQLAIEAPADPAAAVDDPILRELEVESGDAGDAADEDLPQRTREAFGLAIAFDPQRVMYTERDDMQEAFGDDNGYHILRFALGAGSITLFSDLQWLRNEQLGEQDHARLLHRFTVNAQAEPILLVHDLRPPSLLSRLLDAIPLTFIALGVAMILVLLRVTRRFGPRIVPAQVERRRLLEHIEAAGYYLWSEGFASSLLDAARQRVKHRLYQLWPELKQADPSLQRSRLAEITRLPEETIDSALFETARGNREGFTRQIRRLEQLRKRL